MSAQRVVICSENDLGEEKTIKIDVNSHLETAIHDPLLPFGSVHTEKLTPIFQTDCVYGINPNQVNATTGINVAGTTSATNTGTSNIFRCSTGTTAYSFATIQSRKRLRYRAGQGLVGRFAGGFTSPVANSILVAGFGTSEAGFYFGYNGTSFGILHSTGGVREIQTLTVSTASTATNNYVVTVGNVAFTVTATNNNSTTKTAYEISKGTYAGWKAEARGATVIFIADSVGNKTGTFSLAQTGAATPAAGTFAETIPGVASTDTWYPQTEWNGDKLDGTGPSGVTIDPSKGNVYQIGVQYLGFGTVTFKVEVTQGDNNPTMVSCHTISFPNSLTGVHTTQPSFPFTMAAYSAGSTSDCSVYVGSFAGFIEGEKLLHGPRMTYTRETSGFVSSTADTYYPLFTVRNDYAHSHAGRDQRANQSVVQLLSISSGHDDATPVGFFLIKNATLLGTPNFVKSSPSSCTYWDKDATTCTFTDLEQLIFVAHTGQASGDSYSFSDKEITLQPGETLTLAARAVTGTATYVSGALNTREDQ
jgi:hypothetical protein